MTGIISFFARGLAWGVFWIYGFSIVIGQRPVFMYLNEFFVKNSMVESVDRKLAETLESLRTQTFAGRDDAVQHIKKF